MQMNWLRRFMMGRYGGDQLSMVLLIFSVVLGLLAELLKMPLISSIGYIPLGICIFRSLSRDISKRSMENYKFTMLTSSFSSRLKRMKNQGADAKTHRYFKCPNCRTKLRLPKGKGKIIITCPKCRKEFVKKT